MDLNRFVRIIWKWLWLIVLGTVLAGTVSYQVSRTTPTYYQTATTIMIGQFIQEKNPNVGVLTTIERLAQSYAEMARRRPVLTAVVEELKLNTTPGALASRVNVRLISGTQLMEIRVTDTDPAQATAIANEIARQLILKSPTEDEKRQDEQRQFAQTQMRELEGRISESQDRINEIQQAIGSSTNPAEIADHATRLETINRQVEFWQRNYATLLASLGDTAINRLAVIEPASAVTRSGPSPISNIVLSSIAGALLALLAVFCFEHFDDTIRGREDIGRRTGLSEIGSFIRQAGGDNPLVTVAAPDSFLAEQFRLVRTRLLLAEISNPHLSLVVTSPGASEGKTLVAANLAASMAQTGSPTVLVDASFQAPQLHHLFHVEATNALAALVDGDLYPISNALVPTEIPNLSLLPSGDRAVELRDRLTPERVATLIDQLSGFADVVVFDTSSVLASGGAAAIAAKARATLLVAESGRTMSAALRRAQETLESTGANVIGVVVNKTSDKTLVASLFDIVHRESQRREIVRLEAQCGRQDTSAL